MIDLREEILNKTMPQILRKWTELNVPYAVGGSRSMAVYLPESNAKDWDIYWMGSRDYLEWASMRLTRELSELLPKVTFKHLKYADYIAIVADLPDAEKLSVADILPCEEMKKCDKKLEELKGIKYIHFSDVYEDQMQTILDRREKLRLSRLATPQKMKRHAKRLKSLYNIAENTHLTDEDHAKNVQAELDDWEDLYDGASGEEKKEIMKVMARRYKINHKNKEEFKKRFNRLRLDVKKLAYYAEEIANKDIESERSIQDKLARMEKRMGEMKRIIRKNAFERFSDEGKRFVCAECYNKNCDGEYCRFAEGLWFKCPPLEKCDPYIVHKFGEVNRRQTRKLVRDGFR